MLKLTHGGGEEALFLLSPMAEKKGIKAVQ
jgi:hypothetical protein